VICNMIQSSNLELMIHNFSDVYCVVCVTVNDPKRFLRACLVLPSAECVFMNAADPLPV